MLDLLIKFFVHKTKGHITKLQLVKFLYMADLYSVKWTGKQLTDLDWYYYLRGPWHEDIDAALERMNGKDIFLQKHESYTLVGIGSEVINVEELELPQSLQLMLDNIRREWAGSGQEKMNQLLSYVYSTAPMLEVKDGGFYFFSCLFLLEPRLVRFSRVTLLVYGTVIQVEVRNVG